jgi:hypothetical protein
VDWPILLLSLIALTGCLVVAVWQGRRLQVARKAPLAIVSTVLAAGALPLLQFWQASGFLPSQTDSALTQTVSPVVVNSDLQLLTNIEYKLTNDLDRRIVVIISAVTVCAWPNESAVVYDDQALRNRDNCQLFRPANERSWISAKSSTTWRTAVAIPVDQPVLQIVARIVYARGDRLRLTQSVDNIGDLGECVGVRAVRIREEARYKALIQPPKYLVYADRSGDGGTNYYLQFADPTYCYAQSLETRHDNDQNNNLVDYYGVTETRQVLVTWLTPPPRKQ